jgi:hypothetical protein
METIVLLQLEKHVRNLMKAVYASNGETNFRHAASYLMVIEQDLSALTAIREVNEAMDVTDAENPLIRKHNVGEE